MFENPHYNLYENSLLGKLKVFANLAQTMEAKTSDQSKHKASILLSFRTFNQGGRVGPTLPDLTLNKVCK